MVCPQIGTAVLKGLRSRAKTTLMGCGTNIRAVGRFRKYRICWSSLASPLKRRIEGRIGLICPRRTGEDNMFVFRVCGGVGLGHTVVVTVVTVVAVAVAVWLLLLLVSVAYCRGVFAV